MRSSTHLTGRFRVEVYQLFAPLITRVDNGHIVGNYGDEIHPNDWEVAPHVRLANLPTYDEQKKLTMKPDPGLRIDLDPKSVEQFVRIYGGFKDAYGHEEEDEEAGDDEEGIACPTSTCGCVQLSDCRALRADIPPSDCKLARLPKFDQDIAEVAEHQENLRRAWRYQRTGDQGKDLNHVQMAIGWNFWDERTFIVNVWPDQRYDEIDLTTNDLWSFIGYLFLRHFVAGKIGVCGNPDCLVPYYLKSRSSQKYCESGPCTEYAHRQYALNWWHETGEKRRTKKRRKSQGRAKR